LKISVIVTLKKEVLDPQGKVVKQTLKNMGYSNISDVRQGKYFQIDISEKDPMKSKDLAEQICKKLLSNTVIENYKVKIEE
jgi:phosphoribosylformylglycinamidine synthase subunit PurS